MTVGATIGHGPVAPMSATRRLAAVSIGWLGISMVADGVPTVLLPHQLLSSGRDDATALGFTTMVAIALGAAVQPLAGRVSDVVGRWPTVVVGVLIAVVGLAMLLSAATLFAGAILALVGVSVAQAGYQPLVPDRVPMAQRGRAGGLKAAFDVAGATLAFIVLAALLSDGASIAAAAVLAAALITPLLLARVLVPAGDGTARTRVPGVRLQALLASVPPGLIGVVVARFFFLLGIYGVGRFLLLYVGERLDLGADEAAAQAGIVLGLLAMVTVAASFPAGWLADRVGRRSVLLVGGLLGAAGIGLLPLADSLVAIALFGVLMALGSAAFSAASWAAMTDLTPSADAGRLLALANLGTAGAAAAAGGLGLLIDLGNADGSHVGYAAAFLLAAAFTLVGGITAWRVTNGRALLPSARIAEVPR